MLEDLWLDNADASRQFYQGLIHLATAYQHLFRGNMRGCAQRFASTLKYLQAYGQTYEGLNLAPIYENIHLWQNRLAHHPSELTPYTDAEVPQLTLAGETKPS